MNIYMRLNPKMGDNSTNLMTISIPNGVYLSIIFTKGAEG